MVDLESYVSSVQASYWPKFASESILCLNESGTQPTLPSRDVQIGASYSFFLGRKKVIVRVTPTFRLRDKSLAAYEYIQLLQSGEQLHGGNDQSDRDKARMPLEDKVFRRIMQHADPNGTSSDREIIDILNIDTALFWSQLTDLRARPVLGAHISEFQTLHEVLHSPRLYLHLQTIDGVQSLIIEEMTMDAQEKYWVEFSCVPGTNRFLNMYPQIPKLWTTEIKVIPFSDSRTEMYTVISSGAQTCSLFSTLRPLRLTSLQYFPIHAVGVLMSWAFFKAGSITEQESYRITRLKGYVMSTEDENACIGVLFEWRDVSRTRVEDMGLDFSRTVLRLEPTRTPTTGDTEAWQKWNTKVEWKNYLDES